MLKRYIAFVYDEFDQVGGWGDVISEPDTDHHNYEFFGFDVVARSFDNVDDAMFAIKVALETSKVNVGSVIDLRKGKQVAWCDKRGNKWHIEGPNGKRIQKPLRE